MRQMSSIKNSIGQIALQKGRPRESGRSKRSLSGVFDLRLEIVEPD